MPTPPDSPPPRAVVGTDALVALAVPARFALLSHLLSAGPRTASQCAAVVGETASNCSWHLRALAKVGLVEPAPPQEGRDARQRPWQATSAGFDFSGGPEPAAEVARAALAGMSAQHEDDLFQRYLTRHARLPDEWAQVAAANSYALELTPEEMRGLLEALDALIRPFVRPIREDAPAGSSTAHVTLRAFLNPDVHDEST